MTLISVFIPVYNTEKYIGKSIESVLRQTFSDFEIIIVDDHSTDNTNTICCQYASKDSRIKVFRNPKNLGMMANWNKGLELCRNKYFAKLDADDYWHEKMLEDCIDVLEKDPEVGLVLTNYKSIDENDNPIEKDERVLPEYVRNTFFYSTDLVKQGVRGMFKDNILKQGISLIRRKVFDELGVFSLHDAGDTEMWFRIGAYYKLYAIDQTYYFYRVWSENFTRTQVLKFDKKEKNLFEVRQIIIEFFGQKSFITKSDYRKFTQENLFEYNKYLSYKYRSEGQHLKSVGILTANFFRNPLKVIQFYAERFTNRF